MLVIKGFSPNELKFFWDEDGHIYRNNKTEGYDDVVKRGFGYYYDYNICSYDDFLQEVDKYYNIRQSIIHDQINSSYYSFWDMHVYENLQNDLMKFFKNAYTNIDFFKSIGTTLQAQCFDDFEKIHKKEMDEIDRIHEENPYKGTSIDFYKDYVIDGLMSYFKDIMVQYLGYDSIERKLKLNPNKDNMFKVITISCTNLNERFYNWLLMEWSIQKIPRMYWSKIEKRFIKGNPISNYYQTEKEEILGKEIESIKREVPKQYRKDYFRK